LANKTTNASSYGQLSKWEASLKERDSFQISQVQAR